MVEGKRHKAQVIWIYDLTHGQQAERGSHLLGGGWGAGWARRAELLIGVTKEMEAVKTVPHTGYSFEMSDWA